MYSIQFHTQFGFLFHERRMVLEFGWNRSWEVALGIRYRDVSARTLSMRFSSWAVQNILEVEGRRIYRQNFWEQNAGCIKEFKKKVGLSNLFPLFGSHYLLSDTSSILSTLQHWSSVKISTGVSLPIYVSTTEKSVGKKNTKGTKCFVAGNESIQMNLNRPKWMKISLIFSFYSSASVTSLLDIFS